ncbi:cytochrome c550 [Virgibacillus sp. W0181]|uniref:cytochrome c550 n=1 Tax=Virgibacillus sp. W0181 TaxID=3391581 RepID=UPI003F460448
MKKNLLPFAAIAVVGLFAIVIVSYIGLTQRAEIQQAEENGGEPQTEDTEEASADDPEAIFANSCASCHGADLSGGAGPDLTKVGGDLSKDEIKEIIINGTDGGMPGGLVNDGQAEALAEWLGEMK